MTVSLKTDESNLQIKTNAIAVSLKIDKSNFPILLTKCRLTS